MRCLNIVFVLSSIVVLVSEPSSALAVITFELRPPTQSVVAGQQVEIGLYAVADPAEPVGIVQIVLGWASGSLTLVGQDTTGAHPWATSAFPGGGLNIDFGDGDAFFTAKVSACSPATASPAGLFVTTLVFDADGSLGASTVNILPMLNSFETRVWDNLNPFCDGVIVPSAIGQSASVTIVACSDDGECDDANACTTDSCNGVACEHLGNFDDTQFCCNPANGGLETLFDGNECTGQSLPGTPGQCDPLTGQVTHFPLPVGTMCGDQTNSTCTAPDSCDSGGNCVPNHATNGNFCEADGDTCTKDRCSNGDCIFVQDGDDGVPCDDGQENCTPGQDTCQGGVCSGTGTDPCIAQPGDFCLETEGTGPLCPTGDADCAGFQDSTCDNDPAEPRCRRPYTCGSCRPGFNDCPDDGDCLVPTCTLAGICLDFLEDEPCQDGQLCNGAEFCEAVGSPPIAGLCRPDPTPPCVGQSCREETCCDGQSCDENLCECVECILDGGCDDANPCNGLETCDLLAFACIPGVAVDCSILNDQCLVGVCNPADGLCESEPTNLGFPCDDGQSCTSVDTCTPEGLCEGIVDESPDGTVDLQWDPNDLNHGAPDQNVGETIRFDIWAVANDANVCQISGEACATDPDCPKLCDIDGVTPCNSSNDCLAVGGGFCNIPQICIPSEHNVSIIQAVFEFDATVLQFLGNVDPCVATPGDCTECTNDVDCAAGVSCYCPGGPPCGDQPNEPVGVCQTGLYEWGVSGFPAGGGGLDPDGINVTHTDGTAFYLATARSGDPKPPHAPVLSTEPLWVTTLEFQAIVGAASTTVNFIACTGDFSTRTRVIGDGAGNFITGDLGKVTIRIRECAGDGDCDDLIPCTVDSCNAEFQCVHTPDDQSCDNSVFCDGVEICDPLSGCVSPGDPCVGQDLSCKEPPGACVECLQDSDCNDSVLCTNDACVNDVCEHQDTCPDDGIFCNGTEFCDVAGNACVSSGDPCPGDCDEANLCPSCDPPIVESVGPRYIAITPQPEVNPTPTAFLVESPDWPCLSKYVGTFSRCGGTDGLCASDAECNSCTLFNSPCLSDADCKTCQGSTNLCQSSADCDGAPCEFVQICQLSGQTCSQADFFEEIDLNNDGLFDGIIATLVDDPADRSILTAEEWGTIAYPRCSHSQQPCDTDADCDIGACSFSGTGCSISAADCRGLCAIGQTECGNDNECPIPGDECIMEVQTCLPFETCQAGKIYVKSADILPTEIDSIDGTLFPSLYTVQADCGSLSDPVPVVMRLWADADDSGRVNFADVQLVLLGFQSFYPPSVPSRTLVAFDFDGSTCTPNQLVNINDVLITVLAFQGDRFNPDVLDSFPDDCQTPCP